MYRTSFTSMESDNTLEELKLWLDSHGEARAPASESEPVTIFHSTQNSEIIIELMRYKLYHAYNNTDPYWSSERDKWKAQYECLLGDVRKTCIPESPGHSTCMKGGTLSLYGCNIFRHNISSIATQINNLALGFSMAKILKQTAGIYRCATDDKVPEAQEHLQRELDTVLSERDFEKSELGKIKTRVDQLQSEKSELTALVEKQASDFQALQKDAADSAKLRSAIEILKGEVKAGVSRFNTNKIASKAVLETITSQYSALEAFVKFQLESIPKEDGSREREDLDKEADGYRHRRLQVLMKLKEFNSAEPLAKDILDWRISNLGKKSKDTQEVFMDYCKILEERKQFPAVAIEYENAWSDDNWANSKFKGKVGKELARLHYTQEDWEKAVVWYSKVADHRLNHGGKKGAAKSALKMASVQLQIARQLSPSSIDTLGKIWDMVPKDRKFNPKNTLHDSVLSCGQKLATDFITAGKDDEAKPILMVIWRGLDEKSKKHIAIKLATAHLLVGNLRRLGGDDHHGDLDTIQEWIVQRTKDAGSVERSLQYQHQLGCVQPSRGDAQDAENKPQKTWARGIKEEELASSHLTIQFGWGNARAITDSGDQQNEAKDIFQKLWDALKTSPGPRDPSTLSRAIVVLTIGRLLGELLLPEVAADGQGLGEKQKADYVEADKVLSSAWNEALPKMSQFISMRQVKAMADLLWVGDAYGESLMHTGHPSEAVSVLKRVLQWRKAWYMTSDELTHTSQLLNDARNALRAVPMAAEESTTNHALPGSKQPEQLNTPGNTPTNKNTRPAKCKKTRPAKTRPAKSKKTLPARSKKRRRSSKPRSLKALHWIATT